MIATPARPPGSKAPAWLQTLDYTIQVTRYLETAGAQYGDIFRTRALGNSSETVVTSAPAALQQLFSGDSGRITSPTNQLLIPIVGDNSILSLTGKRHRRERKLLMPPFHGDRLQYYGRLICDLSERAMARRAPGQPFTAREFMQDVSLEVILKVVFGIAAGERFAQIKQLIVRLTAIFRSPLLAGCLFFPALQKDFGTWKQFRAVQRQIDELLFAQIRERREHSQDAPAGTDILSLLLAARDEAGEAMSDRELRDELMTLLLAGHETTANATAWALYLVYRHPAVRERLQAEVRALGERPDPMAVVRLPYLTAVCNEALRLHPVAVLTAPRIVSAPIEMLGYACEPGTILYGCIYLTHRRPELYPQPQAFKPERFLERQFSPYEFLPFGGGERRCIGEALAQFELKLVVAMLVSRYSLQLADNRPEVPRRSGVIVVPSRGVPMVLQG